jgi:preprotein translocase subunit SecG
MATLISVLIIIVAILLILIVLVQNPKGGGLSSSFSSSNQVMGVRKTADFLEKTTWTLAISLIVLSLATNIFMKSSAAGPDNQEPVESATRKVASEKAISAPPVAPPTQGTQNNNTPPQEGQK